MVLLVLVVVHWFLRIYWKMCRTLVATFHHVFNFPIYARRIDGITGTAAGFLNALDIFMQNQEYLLLARLWDNSLPIH